MKKIKKRNLTAIGILICLLCLLGCSEKHQEADLFHMEKMIDQYYGNCNIYLNDYYDHQNIIINKSGKISDLNISLGNVKKAYVNLSANGRITINPIEISVADVGITLKEFINYIDSIIEIDMEKHLKITEKNFSLQFFFPASIIQEGDVGFDTLNSLSARINDEESVSWIVHKEIYSIVDDKLTVLNGKSIKETMLIAVLIPLKDDI